MYSYINGVIKEIESTYITVDVNGVGYLIYTPNPYSFTINDKVIVFVHQVIREDENSLYGFKTKEEKEMFLKLISVKGLGPKMALPMLATGSISGIMDAIERENILYLKKFPKIGDKVAKQIILDLKGKVNGHGAYLKLDQEVILKAKKTGVLERHLEVKIPENIYDELLELANKKNA